MSCVGVLSRLHNAVGNLATYICLRQSFVAISFERCRYFLAHVACRNLPWQGLFVSKDTNQLAYQTINNSSSISSRHFNCTLVLKVEPKNSLQRRKLDERMLEIRAKPYFSIFSFEASHTGIGYKFHSFTFMNLKKGNGEVLTSTSKKTSLSLSSLVLLSLLKGCLKFDS